DKDKDKDKDKDGKDGKDGKKDKDIIGKDGKRYVPDPYNEGKVLAVDDGAIPSDATGATPNLKDGSDTWLYARTNHKDHFAEHYTKAINAPEKLAKDLIDAPAKRVIDRTTARDVVATRLATARAKSPSDPKEIVELQTSLKNEQDQLDDAIRDQKAQKRQYDIMRKDIFHADKATSAAANRLRKKGVDATKIKEFRDRAARAQTPQQVDLIASEY
ncbi:MAG TPA: hypothetical protein VNO30_17240, partial [Kofleriaceae bacterium]|nr:hypothetical protein [Kofleriaceae bacterium]